MLSELVSRAPVPSRKPPGCAGWKAPLQYHFLAWGGDDRYLVAARGRIRRTTTWIPLEKVQSIRWEQGPVQRRLWLASVRLDVAGRRTTGSVQDRDVGRGGRPAASAARPDPRRPHPRRPHPRRPHPGGPRLGPLIPRQATFARFERRKTRDPSHADRRLASPPSCHPFGRHDSVALDREC
jgi:hypothetical protein